MFVPMRRKFIPRAVTSPLSVGFVFRPSKTVSRIVPNSMWTYGWSVQIPYAAFSTVALMSST